MSLRNILFTVAGVRLRHAADDGAAAGRGRLSQRLGDARPDHRGRAVHAGGGRAAGAADPQRRPAAGGHRLDQPAARDRRRAPGPGGREDRLPVDNRLVGRGPAVRVSERPRRAARHRSRRCDPGSGWRSSGRAGRASRRWAGCCPGSTRRGPDRSTVGGVELVALPLDVLRTEVALVTQEHHVFVGSGPGQHHPGPRVLTGRGGDRGPADGRGLGLGGAAAPAAGHHAGLGQHQADPGAGPADRAGPAGGRRSAHPGAGRGDLADRPAHRPASGGLDGGAAAGPDRGRHRPPAAHRPRRRPDRGGDRRPDRRAGQPPRAGRPPTGSTPGSGGPGRRSACCASTDAAG